MSDHDETRAAMTWNHRITREKITNPDGSEDYLYSLREVYYRDGLVVSWTADPIAAVGDTAIECADTLARMSSCAALGVLDLETRETLTLHDRFRYAASVPLPRSSDERMADTLAERDEWGTQ